MFIFLKEEQRIRMKEKINRLARGIIDRDIPRLRFYPERFDDVLPPDAKRKYDRSSDDVVTSTFHLR